MALRYFPPIGSKMMSDPMAAGNLKIDYVWEGDLLCLWNDLQGATSGFDVATNTILTAFHTRDGNLRCRGFDLYDAAKMLLEVLKEAESQRELCEGELRGLYTRETDILTLCSSRHTAICDQPIAKGLTAHCTERGLAVGFTLERASELLLPYLETWRPWTDEEMAEIRKRMV
jgi:hypothetical protein